MSDDGWVELTMSSVCRRIMYGAVVGKMWSYCLTFLEEDLDPVSGTVSETSGRLARFKGTFGF